MRVCDTEELIKVAIAELTDCEIVAVYCEGEVGGGRQTYLGRPATIDAVTMSGQDTDVFVFDVQTLGKDIFTLGLNGILESGDITKLVYDFRAEADVLHHIYDVDVKNLFDLQVGGAGFGE